PQASEARVASLTWALDGQLNANPFTTKGVARMSSPVPRVEASASFSSLDLNRLLPAQAATTPASSASAATPAAGSPADTAVDLSALALLDGRLDLSAKQLAWRHFRVADAQLQASLESG